MDKNIFNNEYEIFNEIYNDLTFCENVLIETFNHKNINNLDKQYALNVFKNETNSAINTVLLNSLQYNYFDYSNIENKNLPKNYIKPSNLELLQKINSLNKKQINFIVKLHKKTALFWACQQKLTFCF